MAELEVLEEMWAERSSRKSEACEKLNDQMALQSISERSSLKLYGMCIYNILLDSETFSYGTIVPYMAYAHSRLTFRHTTHLLLLWVAYKFLKSMA